MTSRVLLSGGGGAIGTAIAHRLGRDGWDVVIGYVSEERARALAAALRRSGISAVAAPLDLADPPRATVDAQSALRRHGPFEALVLNAGWTRLAPLVNTTIEDRETTMAVGFLGPVAVVESCLPEMVSRTAGTIVGVTSEAARIGQASNAPYAAAKAALAAYLHWVDQRHRRLGVRAASVAPGPIDSPMLREASASAEHAARVEARLTKLVPLQRLGYATEVASAVALLVNGVSISGAQLSVGGGITMVG